MSKRGPKARDGHGAWDFGGGGIDFGESPEETVRRELLEEFGCQTIRSIQALPVLSIVREREGRKDHWIGFPFLIEVDPSEVRINEPGFIDEIGWFDIDQLPSPTLPGVAPIIEAIKRI